MGNYFPHFVTWKLSMSDFILNIRFKLLPPDQMDLSDAWTVHVIKLNLNPSISLPLGKCMEAISAAIRVRASGDGDRVAYLH